eukprot:s1155_g17.t1
MRENQDLQAAAADTSISGTLSKYLDHFSRGWQDLGSITERLRRLSCTVDVRVTSDLWFVACWAHLLGGLSELKQMLDFKIDLPLPSSFAPDVSGARRLLGAWQDSPQEKPQLSRYWQRRGIDVALGALPRCLCRWIELQLGWIRVAIGRGTEAIGEDVECLLKICELSARVYWFFSDDKEDLRPGDVSTDAPPLSFDARLVAHVDERTTADLQTLAWFACDLRHS